MSRSLAATRRIQQMGDRSPVVDRSLDEQANRRRAAALLRAMAHPVRLAILKALSSGPRCVGDIQHLVDVPQANVSQHLAALRHQGIVDCHEQGNLRCYYIARPSLVRRLLPLLEAEHPISRPSMRTLRRAAGQRDRATGSDPQQQGG